MTAFESSPDFHFPGLDTAAGFREALAAAHAAGCSEHVFQACLRPVVYSRHHWLVYKGEYRVRADLRGALESAQQRPPTEWDDDEADLLFSLFALDTASVGLDELGDRADSEAVRAMLLERHALYAGVVDPHQPAPAALMDLAANVDAMRAQVEETHELYSIIDGKAWYRTEGVIPKADIDDQTLTASVEQELSSVFGPSVFGPAAEATAAERLAAAARAAVRAEGDGVSAVRALMQAALKDPILRADHVTVTCPMGDMLDRPQEMTGSEAFYTETLLRDGVDLGEYAERLGHESDEQLQRTIRARMLKLKRGAIRSMYGPGCLQGRFVEKHGGHMIFRNEDAHYRGHQSIGCSSGGRASFALGYHSDGDDRVLTPMVGDFRVVRMSHDEADTFSAQELRHVIRYGEWIRIVVEETYRQGAVVRTAAPAVAASA